MTAIGTTTAMAIVPLVDKPLLVEGTAMVVDVDEDEVDADVEVEEVIMGVGVVVLVEV